MINYAIILQSNYAGSKWLLVGDDYSGLTWLSDTPKPTQKKLDDAWTDVQARITQAATDAATARASALAKLAGLGLTADEIAALVG